LFVPHSRRDDGRRENKKVVKKKNEERERARKKKTTRKKKKEIADQRDGNLTEREESKRVRGEKLPQPETMNGTGKQTPRYQTRQLRK
jgi:hypothetical protein